MDSNHIKEGQDKFLKRCVLSEKQLHEATNDACSYFNSVLSHIALLPNLCFCEKIALKYKNSYSTFLGLKSYYIRYKTSKAQRGKHLALNMLNHISMNLKKHFTFKELRTQDEFHQKLIHLVSNNINIITEYYKSSQNLKIYSQGRNGVLEFHPNLNLDYFKIINTLEKAYWLGWVFAEGYITIHGRRKSDRQPFYKFGVGCINTDFIQIQRFADTLGLDIIKNEPTKEEYTISSGDIHIFRRIVFINNKFCVNLIALGFIPGKEKSKNIRLPKFKERKLLLSFLLGYYDGDGTMGRSCITSSSQKFLSDILNSEFLNIKVHSSDSICFDPLKNQYTVKKDRISLGTDLMREMVEIYGKSLPRKRRHWENWIDKRTLRKNYPSPKIDQLYRDLPQKKMLNLYLRENLTLKEIARMYDVSYDTLKRYMRKVRQKP